MDYLLPESPCTVSATGGSHVEGRGENIAYLTLFFPWKLIAHIHVNSLAPVKVRQTLIGASEKVKIYDKGITLQGDPADEYQKRIGYRSGDVWTPHPGTREALAFEATEFANCVVTGAHPTSDGETGLRIVSMLDAAERSMKDRGRPVDITTFHPKQEQAAWSHSLI